MASYAELERESEELAKASTYWASRIRLSLDKWAEAKARVMELEFWREHHEYNKDKAVVAWHCTYCGIYESWDKRHFIAYDWLSAAREKLRGE